MLLVPSFLGDFELLLQLQKLGCLLLHSLICFDSLLFQILVLLVQLLVLLSPLVPFGFKLVVFPLQVFVVLLDFLLLTVSKELLIAVISVQA